MLQRLTISKKNKVIQNIHFNFLFSQIMVSFQKFFSIFDLFQRQFIFYVGNSKAKSTILGGFLSFSAINISFIYLIYLMNLFFSNQIEPKFSVSQYVDAQFRQLTLEKEFLMFQMIIQGEPLNLVEKRMGKKYLLISLKYEEFFMDNSSKSQKIDLVECQDEHFKGYFCADSKQVKPLITHALKRYNSSYGIYVEPCTGLPDCASSDEILDFIFKLRNYFHVAIKTKQYSKETLSFQDEVFTEFFYFDQNLYQFSRLSLTLAETSVKKGNIIQSTQKTNTAYEYKRNDVIFSQDRIQQKFSPGLGLILLQLDEKSVNISIQYPMITEIFAQFMSILNTLFIVGVIARTLAQAGIINDLIEILLKDYYKQTALKLLNSKDNNIQIKKSQEKNIDNKFKQPQQKQQPQDQQEQILSLNKKINQINLNKDEKKFFNTNCCQRIIAFLNKVFRTKFRVDKSNTIESKLHERILQEALQRVNIYSIYSELLKLKMAVKLIFTKEQYAAFLYCGSEYVVENQFSNHNLEVNKVKQLINNKKIDLKQTIDATLGDINFTTNFQNNLSNIHLLPSSFSERKKIKNNEILSTDIQLPLQNQFDENNNIEKQIYLNNLHLSDRPTEDINKLISSRSNKQYFSSPLINKLNGDQELIDMKYSQEIQCFSDKTKAEKEKTFQKEENVQQEQEFNNVNLNQNQSNEIMKNKFERNCLEISDIQQKQYLHEMDQIEQICQIREEYFKSFIKKIRDNKSGINRMDINIYNNLINTSYLSTNLT